MQRVKLNELPKVVGVVRFKVGSPAVLIENSGFRAHVKHCRVWGEINEDKYCAKYKDVARAVQSGAIDSATSHYLSAGYAEGRVAEILPHTPDSEIPGIHISKMPTVLGVVRSDGLVQNVLVNSDEYKAHVKGMKVSGAINEEDYFDRYSDAAAAVAEKKLNSAVSHYIRIGYFEGRTAHVV